MSPCSPTVAQQYAQLQIPLQDRSAKINGSLGAASDIYHLKATAETFELLSDFGSKFAAPEICIHYIIYDADDVVISGYDAFDDPLYVADSIHEERIKEFATATATTFSLVKNY